MRIQLFQLAFPILLFSASDAFAQTEGKVDFAKDVMPILRQNCIECHGPTKQKNGLRLDRKSSVMKRFSRRITPGSSANSMVYHRMIGEEYGTQMPPKGALPAQQIEVIRSWIDQGADWPEALANDADLPPPDAKALAMIDALHRGDMAEFLKIAEEDPALLNARGPEGSTPFMYAALYADAPMVARLLKLGADPDKRNDANATALMWAARDLEKAKVLCSHGAHVNAKSDDNRTPLMIAARRPGAVKTVKYLLDRGANPNPNAKPNTESSPLLEALAGGDEAIIQVLIDRGADAGAAGEMGLTLAVMNKCSKAFQLLAQKMTNSMAYHIALQLSAVFGDAKAAGVMLDHGADANGYDLMGRTPLMYAAISELMPLDMARLLIERGADVNAVNKHSKSGDAGLSVLDIAQMNGKTRMVELLEKAGAKSTPQAAVALRPKPKNTIRNAVQDSLPLIQRADSFFAKNASCFSCHNNSMQAMSVGLARERGFKIDEETASAQVKFNVQALETLRSKLHQGYMFEVGDTFCEFILGYVLIGLAAENYKADLNTDAAVLLIQSRQKPNGEWPAPRADQRPPICMNYIGQTVIAMRALQLYAPAAQNAACDRSVQRAAFWLAKAAAQNTEDRCWRLIGLVWAGAEKKLIKAARKELLATQRPDGGWSDIPTLESAPYATGRSLVALQMGGLPVSDPAYERGINFLLATQQTDGSWHTKTRALAFQPYFEGSFPHGYDQWISAAATSWAAMALTLALPEGGPLTASQLR